MKHTIEAENNFEELSENKDDHENSINNKSFHILMFDIVQD